MPRPIAWVSTADREGRPNLAPYSYFNGVGAEPPMLMFSVSLTADGVKKDTLRNVELTGEFVVNVVSAPLAEQMNLTATDFPPEVSEFAEAGLSAAPCVVVRAPRVAEAPVSMECRLVQVVPAGRENFVVLGEVVYFHVDDAVWHPRGWVDAEKLQAVGRMGGNGYCHTRERFDLKRLRWADLKAGR